MKSPDDILEELLSLPSENEIVEFKKAENQFDKDDLGKYFSALSNEANLKSVANAWIVIGVKDDRTISGTNITDQQINSYKQEIGKNTSPTINFIKVYRVCREGKQVLLFAVPPTPKGMPIAWKGHRYGRDGESLVGLNDTKYSTIKSQLINEDWSAKIIKEATINDLSKEAIKKAREQYSIKNPKLKEEIATWSDTKFLDKAKLTIKGEITNTAIILLGKPESEHYLSPSVAKLTWILKDKDNIEKDYEHFSCPFILSIDNLKLKIRNLKYRYIKEEGLFPEEVEQYDPFIIREALNNAIAHQDYTLGGKTIVVENEKGTLSFSNSGDFIPKDIEYVVTHEIPEDKYRNPFLANAMVNLNMIDTIGSGIKRMFIIQKDKYFPLPDYNFNDRKVQVTFTGKVIDLSFAKKIAKNPNLSLTEIYYLDKVAKKKPLTDNEIKVLKRKKLIEGRKPNFYISSQVADISNLQEDYIKQKGIDSDYIKKVILDYLNKFHQVNRKSLESILLPKISERQSIQQKKDKIKNILQQMRREGLIITENRIWKLPPKN
jgi:putative transcriptional regulator